MKNTFVLIMAMAITLSVTLAGEGTSWDGLGLRSISQPSESVAKDRVVRIHSPEVQRFVRKTFGGIYFGFGGRHWGVFFAIPLGRRGIYLRSHDPYYDLPPDGYMKKCKKDGGKKRCRYVPKPLYWDWKADGL
jgi:hypothetical protein